MFAVVFDSRITYLAVPYKLEMYWHTYCLAQFLKYREDEDLMEPRCEHSL